MIANEKEKVNMAKFRLLSLVLAGAVMTASGLAQGTEDHEGHRQKHERFEYEVLHNFQGKPDAQGNFDPLLVQGFVTDERGTIYGGSLFGGSVGCAFLLNNVCLVPSTNGAEFRLERDGHFTLFANLNDVEKPKLDSLGPLLLDDAGRVLFTAQAGGLASFVNGNHLGGLFSLDPNTGAFENLFTLTGPPADGNAPAINVIRDAKGNFYGTTLFGGRNPSFLCSLPDFGGGCGTVYKLDAETHHETVLHTFSFDDGWQPVGLAVDSSGNLIGAASLGDDKACGATLGCGEIFRIDPLGSFSLIHEFHHTPRCPFISCPPSSGPGPELLGWNPQFVVLDEQGNIFGIAGAGGKFGLGVIFKIDPTGHYSVLHHFAGPGDGFGTVQILLKDGMLYGANEEGDNT